MNSRKWARFLGIKGTVELPLIQLFADISKLAGFPHSGAQSSPAEVASFNGGVRIEPGVGGIASGTNVYYAPNPSSLPTVTGGATQDVLLAFAPGLFDVSLWGGLFVASDQVGVLVRIIRATPSAGAPGAGLSGFVPFLGSAAQRQVLPVVRQQVYSAVPWQLQFQLLGAWVDADVAYFGISVNPIHLLDDGPSAE